MRKKNNLLITAMCVGLLLTPLSSLGAIHLPAGKGKFYPPGSHGKLHIRRTLAAGSSLEVVLSCGKLDYAHARLHFSIPKHHGVHYVRDNPTSFACSMEGSNSAECNRSTINYRFTNYATHRRHITITGYSCP